jgi:hypothetical protein
MQCPSERELLDSELVNEIRQHIETAMRLMDSVKPASAFGARCQEALDGLPQERGSATLEGPQLASYASA